MRRSLLGRESVWALLVPLAGAAVAVGAWMGWRAWTAPVSLCGYGQFF